MYPLVKAGHSPRPSSRDEVLKKAEQIVTFAVPHQQGWHDRHCFPGLRTHGIGSVGRLGSRIHHRGPLLMPGLTPHQMGRFEGRPLLPATDPTAKRSGGTVQLPAAVATAGRSDQRRPKCCCAHSPRPGADPGHRCQAQSIPPAVFRLGRRRLHGHPGAGPTTRPCNGATGDTMAPKNLRDQRRSGIRAGWPAAA